MCMSLTMLGRPKRMLLRHYYLSQVVLSFKFVLKSFISSSIHQIPIELIEVRGTT